MPARAWFNPPMHPLRTYNYLTLSRSRVLDAVRPLPPAHYLRPFPIGPGSLAATLTHIYISEWYYIQRLLQREVPPYETWPIRDDRPPTFPDLERHWAEQAAATRAAFESITDWDAPRNYRVTGDDGVRRIVEATAADLFTQLAFHEIHHRAQVLNMVRQLGSPDLGDLDFNALMYARREEP